MSYAPKKPAERKAAERERRRREGLTRLEVYAHPDDHPPIKQYAERLRKKRGKRAAPEPRDAAKQEEKA